MQNPPNVIYARAETTIILTYDSVPGGQATVTKRDLQLARILSLCRSRDNYSIIHTYDSVPGGQDTITKRDLQLASDVSNHPW